MSMSTLGDKWRGLADEYANDGAAITAGAMRHRADELEAWLAERCRLIEAMPRLGELVDRDAVLRILREEK